jgi:acyl-CoA thioesterase II
VSDDVSARVDALFALDAVGVDTFRTVPARPEGPFGGGSRRPWARGGGGSARLFGGQVASQALMAAVCTVEADHHVNSLHAYFLRPGRYGVPIDYVVDRIRDGSSFTTRRVVARQGGDAILNLDASFHRDEPGEEHTPPSPVPTAGVPEEADDPPDPPWGRGRPVEVRHVRDAPPGVRSVWVRVPGKLPDDPGLHACMLTFLSDMGPVGVVSGTLATPRGSRMMASLDHCMWFHHPARADEWLLYQLEAVATARARGVARGTLWTQGGLLVASLVQEVLARPRDPRYGGNDQARARAPH